MQYIASKKACEDQNEWFKRNLGSSGTGVDRWGTGGRVPPPFSGWGDSIGIVPPPLFSSEK